MHSTGVQCTLYCTEHVGLRLSQHSHGPRTDLGWPQELLTSDNSDQEQTGDRQERSPRSQISQTKGASASCE